jgi:uncharacterized protein (TIGR03437 family)
MKFLAFLLASGTVLPAQQFMTGQAARAVIGQPTFTRQEPGASQFLVGGVSGLAYADGTLFVVDSNRVNAQPQNHRVLVYNNVSGKFPTRLDPIPYTEVRCPLCGGFADNVIGQADFTSTSIGTGNNKFRNPTAVATDGRVLAVADTDNNRVLIWNSIPTTAGAPANIVVGQADFTGTAINFGRGSQVSAQGLRGPQGVWIDARGRFWVADTQNHRVLMWNRVPTQNGAAADLVVGKPDLTTFIDVNLVTANQTATASSLLNPVSVTVDPMDRLIVSDLGQNRVLIWNAAPTRNGQAADVVVGQLEMASTAQQNHQNANNSQYVCRSNGKDAQGRDTFPALCEATLNFPRFALSDGQRLFIADGGNNRVLVFNRFPTANGMFADVVLGQLTAELDQDSEPLRISAADSVRTPMSLAWDGTNLYVSDPFNRRVMVWTVGDQTLPLTGVRNAASKEVFAIGSITFTADPKENDEVTLTVGTGDAKKEYKYKAAANQKISNVINGLVEAVNAGAGDPLVFATPNVVFNSILLTSRVGGDAGNQVEFTVAFSAGAQLAGSGSGRLSGGQDAAKIAPGSLVTILGENLAEAPVSAPAGADRLPGSLGGVEVYFDGKQAPLLFVSPDQINAQMPWEVNDASSVNAYVRITGRDGRVRTSTAIAVPIIPENPGIFAEEGTDPRPARAVHGSNNAVGVVSVDGGIKAGDQVTVSIGDRNYGYTVKEGDRLETIRDALVAQINQDDPEVEAEASTIFTRILLRARTPGAEGEGLSYAARANEGASVIMTALSNQLCCANRENAPVTEANPARPGQLIKIYGTGLGLIGPDEAKGVLATGFAYRGTDKNVPNTFIDAIAGGKTANVLFAGLVPTNPRTQITIAQDIFVSNIATFPVVNPNDAPPEP